MQAYAFMVFYSDSGMFYAKLVKRTTNNVEVDDFYTSFCQYVI